MLAEHQRLLSGLSERWRSLEERLKGAEQVTGVVCIPAINELRYSGRRFFEAWTLSCSNSLGPESEAKIQEHLLMARQYFNNADHDLTDSLISFFVARKKQLLEKYGINKATEFYVRFVTWIDKINDAHDIIRSSRGNRHNRLEDYKILETNFIPVLITQYQDIVRSEELYSAKIKRRRWIERCTLILGTIGYIGGLLCLWAEWDKVQAKSIALFKYMASAL